MKQLGGPVACWKKQSARKVEDEDDKLTVVEEKKLAVGKMKMKTVAAVKMLVAGSCSCSSCCSCCYSCSCIRSQAGAVVPPIPFCDHWDSQILSTADNVRLWLSPRRRYSKTYMSVVIVKSSIQLIVHPSCTDEDRSVSWWLQRESSTAAAAAATTSDGDAG